MNMVYPEFPIHPEPRSFAWSKLEIACIEKYAKACVDADRAQRAATGVQGGETWHEKADRLKKCVGYSPIGLDLMNHREALSAHLHEQPLYTATQPPQESAQPVADEGEDAALSAAMQRGNSLGVKSSDALRIIAAYKVAQPAGLQTCNCRWDGETRVQQCTLHQAWEDNQYDQADELRHFRAAQPVGNRRNEAFESWWTDHGQFLRPGGGQYEKAFAFAAWNAAAAQPVEVQRVPLSQEDREAYLNVASQCRSTATSDIASRILVDAGSGLLRELLNDAADALEASLKPTSSEGGRCDCFP